ncbi:aldehyde dehydrogenase family protein, partial [Pantoea septica]
DPAEQRDLDMGPLINAAALARVEKKVADAVAAGGKVVLGGKRAGEKGFFFQPTIIADVRQDMEIMREEIFGPVLPVMTFKKLDEAIALANDCEYGLTSSLYTRDLNTTMVALRKLKFGETYVNRENFEAMQGFHAGWRKSGIGGADGRHGLEEYLQTHVAYLQFSL